MRTFVILTIVTVTLVIVSFFDNQLLKDKPIGVWEGQVITSVYSYNDEYALNVMVDGKVVILTNQFKDMFTVPHETTVKFSGRIESIKPLVIHINEIGW